MGQSQASHSLQSITDPQHPQPAASGERKISFVLNDNESTESGEKVPHVPHVRLKYFTTYYFHAKSFLLYLVLVQKTE